ncbi:MAG TPA: HdeD family acid-resistance protein [Solirubrobacteraceae bacterium]|jgi:uncharacterized membrane protein HdeD (DUF308 family)
MASNWSEPARGTHENSPGEGRAEDFWASLLTLPPAELRSARRWLIATAAVSIVTGIVALAVPAAASVGTAIFIGWVLVFAGIVMTVHSFSGGSAGRATLAVLNGLLTLIVGLYIVIFPLSGTVTLTFALAVWFFGLGVVELIDALRARGRPGTGILAFTGALSAILGVLIVAELPSSAGWAIGLLVGINLVLWGVRALAFASLIKRATTV